MTGDAEPVKLLEEIGRLRRWSPDSRRLYVISLPNELYLVRTWPLGLVQLSAGLQSWESWLLPENQWLATWVA